MAEETYYDAQKIEGLGQMVRDRPGSPRSPEPLGPDKALIAVMDGGGQRFAVDVSDEGLYNHCYGLCHPDSGGFGSLISDDRADMTLYIVPKNELPKPEKVYSPSSRRR